MDNDRFKPAGQPPAPGSQNDQAKDPYAEPPVKDFSRFLNEQPTPKKKRTGRKVLLVILALIVLAGIGFGAYWQFFRHKPAPDTTKHTTTQKVQSPAATSPAAIPTNSFTSAGFSLSLKYPKTWTVTDGGTASVSIVSPVTQLTAASGQTVSGKILVTVQPQGKLPSSFGSSDATAVLTSQLMSYSNPTSSQRAQTYLSFVQYASTTTLGALDGIYITGNYGYQKDQDVPPTDIANLDPLVTVTFGQCSGTNCTNLTNLSIKVTSWNASSFSAPILTILKSFAFS